MLGLNLLNSYANSQHYRTLQKNLTSLFEYKICYGTSPLVTITIFVLRFV